MEFLNPAFYGLNWLDIILVIVFVFYALEGFSIGFVNASLQLVSFIASFLLGIRLYKVVGDLIVQLFSIPQGFASVIGFFIVAFIAEILISLLLVLIRKYLLTHYHNHFKSVSAATKHKLRMANKVFGVIPNLFSAAILMAFILSLIVALPFAPALKKWVISSRVANYFLAQSQVFETASKNVFGGAVNDTLTFFTIEPKSNETVTLPFKVKNGTVDRKAEERMLILVNGERKKAGVAPVIMDESLRELAREYSLEMFSTGYFSHFSPEGLSPFDRMEKKGIIYTNAGENLALAPNVDLATAGLMQSPGHRANILSVDFGRIGIGVIDGGIYGQMYTQEFTN